jgi:hypothetical protein
MGMAVAIAVVVFFVMLVLVFGKRAGRREHENRGEGEEKGEAFHGTSDDGSAGLFDIFTPPPRF